MIVTEALHKIDHILHNMRVNNSRILASFQLQSSKAIKLEPRKILEDHAKSNKNSRDSTFAESKQKQQQQQRESGQKMQKDKSEKKLYYFQQGMGNLNQIIQDSQDENHSFEKLDPLKNFISPHNWNVTHSRNQQKSFNQNQPQCASFQHIQEQSNDY